MTKRCPEGKVRRDFDGKCVSVRGNKKLCRMLDEAVKDEKKANTKDYPELRKELHKQYSQKPSMGVYNEDFDNINQIIHDEGRHKKELSRLRDRVCGGR